jgi:hypothetical protein
MGRLLAVPQANPRDHLLIELAGTDDAAIGVIRALKWNQVAAESGASPSSGWPRQERQVRTHPPRAPARLIVMKRLTKPAEDGWVLPSRTGRMLSEVRVGEIVYETLPTALARRVSRLWPSGSSTKAP